VAMLPSLHDNFLVGYEVNCEARQIKLYAKRDPRIPGGEHPTRIIVFNGVEGYQFKNDAFGNNVIFSLEVTPVETLLSEHSSQIAESCRFGAHGPWAADMTSAPEVLAAKGIRGFVLSSSYGLSGWILANEVLVTSPLG